MSKAIEREKESQTTDGETATKNIGAPVNSKYGRRLVSGNGSYVDDLNEPDMLHARFVRSPHAHAYIEDIDTAEAEAMPGVELVWTAEDVEGRVEEFGHPSLDRLDDELLATDKVRYVGDEVALVLAEDHNTAVQASERVHVEYELLDAVTTPEQALDDDAPLLYPEFDADPDCSVDGNLLSVERVEVGDVEETREQADIVVSDTFQTNLTNPSPLEPHGAVAKYNPGEGELTIWSSNQAPQTLPHTISEAVIDLEPEDIVAKMPDVGGAFGVKGGHEVYSHEIGATALAMETARPVKLVHDRIESLQVGRGRHPEKFDAELYLSEDGKMLGWDIELVQNTGARGSYGPAIAKSGAICGAGPYIIPTQRVRAEIVYTNVMPGVAVRGFGDPQFTFMREQLIDMAAEELEMDAIELRLMNVPGPEDFPMRSPTGLKWNSGDMPSCIERTCEMINWDEHRGGSRTRDGKYRGIGIGTVMRRCGNKAVEGSDYESAIVRMDEEANVKVFCGIATVGQGTETALCQIIADELGISIDRIKPIVGDTDLTPDGLGVWADRGTIFGGSATAKATEQLKNKLVRLAAHLLEVDADEIEMANERVFERGNPDNGMHIEELTDTAFFGDHENRPEDMKGGISLVGEAKFESEEAEIPDDQGYGSLSHTYSFGAMAILVDVDPTTGEIDVVDLAAVEDAGTIINPKLAEGQTQGGTVHGLGEVLLEAYSYADNGLLENGNLVDYHLPTPADVPLFTKIDSVESPDPTTSHGQKGVGEFSIVPVAAAIGNALYDATGIRFTELPFSTDTVLMKLVDEGMREL